MRVDGPRPRTFAAHLGAIATHSTGARLASIRCPVHVMHGDADVLVPPSNGDLIARLIPGATLERLPKTGHAIAAEDRDVVARGIERVRERVRAA
jgi:pimeloyl-ACP methyl ester carboxylesterase